jgi:hypothetical protein
MFWRIDLQTDGPGLALRDIRAQAAAPVAIAQVVTHLNPDILVLSGLDHDHGHITLRAMADLLGANGAIYPYLHAPPSNAGLRSGSDLNQDGRLHTPDDAQGYGPYPGYRALALLSRLPITRAHDFSAFRWMDLPGHQMPAPDPAQRLSSTGHWDIVVEPIPAQPLHLLIWQAGPPAFGGNPARARARNADETAFWGAYLDGVLPMPPPQAPFVLLGGTNLDPWDGDGEGAVMRNLLNHPAVQDPAPQSVGALASARTDPRSSTHRGPHGLDTVEWPQSNGPGNLRVSYILPSHALQITGAGVFWPAPDDPLAALLQTQRHRPVWVDIAVN